LARGKKKRRPYLPILFTAICLIWTFVTVMDVRRGNASYSAVDGFALGVQFVTAFMLWRWWLRRRKT